MDYFYLSCRRLWQQIRAAQYRKVVTQAEKLEPALKNLDEAAFDARVAEMHTQAQGAQGVAPLLPQALALGREASRRALGMRHYDVQLLGTLALYDGHIAEMETGEGKTLMAPVAAYIHHLGHVGRCVHVVTANEYLAARDAEWMKPLCEKLGLSVGLIVPGQNPTERARAYRHQVVYATAKEIVFDSLREPVRQKRTSSVDAILRPQHELKLDPKYDFAIVDEVDSVLIDQAGSPLSIGGASTVSPQLQLYKHADQVAGALTRGAHYRLMQDDRKIELKDEGKAEARQRAGGALRLLPVGHSWERYVTCALAARYIYKKDQHYVVRDKKIVLIDENTGRLMPGRQLPDGIHQAIEVLNGIEPTAELRGNYQTTFQTYFRKYDKLAGMTGTAQMAAKEFMQVYNLAIVPIPTNRPMQRHVHPDRVYRSLQAKYRALGEEVQRIHETGRPILIGTGSVAVSERVSNILTARGLEHEVLNAKNHTREAEIIAQAGRIGKITIITNMAGRGVDIKLADGVAEQGGMYLLGVDRSAFRRLDDQLTGRVGRQGDPADCGYIVSLKDDLFRYGKRKRIARLRRRTRNARNNALATPDGAKMLEKIQHRLVKLTSKQRHRVFLGEKQREKLRADGMWEDWMDAR